MKSVAVAVASSLSLLAAGSCSEKAKDAESSSGAKPSAPAIRAAPKAAFTRSTLPLETGEHSGLHRFSMKFGGEGNDMARGFAHSSDGGYFVGGYAESGHPFGLESKVKGDHNGFIAKLSAVGALEWSKVIGGSKTDTIEAVAGDPLGNVVATGLFADTMPLGDGVLKAIGSDDIYVIKHDANGRRLWAKSFGGLDSDIPHDIATDRAGNVYMTGDFRQSATFETEKLVSKGDSDIFVLKLSPEGSVLWARSIGSSGEDAGRCLAVDSQGDVVLAAEFAGEIDLGLGPLRSNGNLDVALIKLNGQGQVRWNQSFGNNLNETVLDVATDAADNIALAGGFEDKLKVAGKELKSNGQFDAFVVKFNPDGEGLWARSFGSKDNDLAANVAMDPFGNVYSGGWFWFDMVLSDQKLESAGKRDVFLSKMSPDGELAWLKRFGGVERDSVRGLVASDKGVAIAGTFHYEIDFGGDKLIQEGDTETRVPKSDAFIAAFSL